MDEELDEASKLFPSFLSLLVAPDGVDAGIARFRVNSLGVAIGMKPIEVIHEFVDMAYGVKY